MLIKLKKKLKPGDKLRYVGCHPRFRGEIVTIYEQHRVLGVIWSDGLKSLPGLRASGLSPYRLEADLWEIVDK